MNFYSTNNYNHKVKLRDAVLRGLAPDRGLYMPERIPEFPRAFFNNIGSMSLTDIAFVVASAFFGDEVESDALQRIVNETLNFDIPLVKVADNRYSLELFHGPTLAFKDVGARFMARLLAYFNRHDYDADINVLVATSGDTGSAVANGFLGVEGVHVFVLYPHGKVSKIQEAQFTTLGRNITAIEVTGTFDDCQALVKAAFLDPELNERMKLTSANSINVARFLPQAFYYYHAYAQLASLGLPLDKVVVAVPSGNFGNLCAGLIARFTGLPISRFIAANNANDVFYQYLQSGEYRPRPSVATIANAMDVGDPSNFARILDLYGSDHEAIIADIAGIHYSDDEIADTIKRVHRQNGYLLDPHGACGYQALCDLAEPDEVGVFLETAHPAKFKHTVDHIIGDPVEIPEKLKAFIKGTKQSVKLPAAFSHFKEFLLSR